MQFTTGRLSDEQAKPIEQHVQSCPHCLEALGTLKVDDTLIGNLHAAGTDPDPRESAVVDGLIGQLRQLPTNAPSVAEEATLPPPAPIEELAAESTSELYHFLAPPQESDELGRLGPYRVLKVLGAGGMGVVFQAEDIHLQRLVALKVMNPSLAASPAGRRRFLLEARATAAIEHDHIVTIHQVGEDRGVPFFAMQFLRGESLDDRLKRVGHLPPDEVLRIGREVAEGLAAAHARGLIHRDIKPANVWLEAGKDRVKILDFGLVRAAGGEGHLTKPGTIVGTPEYIPPEQIRGDTVDHRGDLFSLGCMLYRMGTGRLPFTGNDAVVILMAIATEEPPPPQTVNPEISLPLSNLILRLLTKDPAGRPATAQALAQTLEAMASGQGQTVSSAPATPESASNPFAQIGSVAEQTVRVPHGRKPIAGGSARRWRLALATAVVLSCLAVAGLLLGPAIFRVSTDYGELVIEPEDSQVAVLLKKPGVVTIEDRGRKLSYDLSAKPGKLRTGDYGLIVSNPELGLEFETRTFTILRDKRVLVRAWINRKSAPEPPGEPPDRKAERIVATGKQTLSADEAVTDFDVLLDADLSTYLAWTKRIDGQGLRATALSVHTLAGAPQVAAIALKTEESAEWWTLVDQDRDDYVVRSRKMESEDWRQFTGTAYPVGAGMRYASLWVKDSLRPWQSKFDLSESAYLERKKNLKAQGFRLVSLAISREQGERRFLDHWVPSGGLDWEEQHNLTAERLRTVLAECRGRKWRPEFLRAYEDSPDLRFLVILVENRGDVAWTAELDLSTTAYKQELETQKARHLRPLCLSGYALNGETRYAGVWIKNARDADSAQRPRMESAARWSLVYGADQPTFERWLAHVRASGYRPVSVNGHSLSGKPRLAAVAIRDGRDLPGEVYLDNLADFNKRLETMVAQGYWISDYTVYRNGDALACASLWMPCKLANGYYRNCINISPDAYQGGVDDAEANHAYPYRVTAFPQGSSYQLAAFFAPERPGWRAKHALTASECQAFLDGWRAQGYRPESIFVGTENGEQQFGVVIFPEKPAVDWNARLDLPPAALLHEQQEQKAHGYRPQQVVGYAARGGSRYLAVWVRDALAAPGPRTGTEVPELAAFDEVMQRFMDERSISAGGLAVMKNGKLVLSRGYGFADRQGQRPVAADAPFRLASIGKAITNAAIHKLIRDGKLRLDTKVAALLGVTPPAGQVMDPRWQQITVQHLLQHRGGWDRSRAFDPMFRSLEIAAALGKTGPATSKDIVMYMAGQPLQFAPGSATAYSNLGYCLLGRVVEKVTGRSYIEYVRTEVLAPLGIKSITLGHSLPTDRAPGEPYYVEASQSRNVIRPESKEPVPEPDGGFYLEAMDSHGGLIGSAEDVARFLNAYSLNGQPRTPTTSKGCFFGRLPGTFAVALQRPDDVQIVALFNQSSDPSGLDYHKIQSMLDKAATSIKTWPAH
jgi:serine/threonine protein kinase/CubicO group peptidase (beta-lactamase class C family)